jgi:hypothetical protein
MNTDLRPRSALITALSVAALTLALVSCKSEPPKPFVKESLQEKTATVESINQSARMVSLRGEDGRYLTIAVPPEVKNLAQVKAGDKVVVSYYQGVAAEVKKAGEGVAGVEHTMGDVTAKPGEMPGHAIGSMVRTTVQVESVDTSFHTLTFKRADGMIRVIAVESPDGQRFIGELKPGDHVEVTYAEAVAVSVRPAH